MNNKIFVFDNFYDDPYLVRNFALKCNYTLTAPKSWKDNTESILWPGKSTESTYREKSLDIKLSKLLKFPVRTAADSGFFRLSYKNDSTDYVVHTDGINDRKDRSFSVIVYLTPIKEIDQKNGTLFYRHKKTNAIQIDTAHGYINIVNDYKIKEAWDIYHTIKFRFNRVIVFESSMFHSSGECFGECNTDARLVQIFRANEIV